MKRVMSMLGTAAVAAGVLVGTAAQADAASISSYGPYRTATICEVFQTDMRRASYRIGNPCHYNAAYVDSRGNTVPAGWYFLAYK